MVWGEIRTDRWTPLMIVEGNLTDVRCHDEIVCQHVIPFIHNNQRKTIMQQDIVRSYNASVLCDNLQQQNVNMLP